MTLIWTALIYWLVLFVACFVVVEFGHDQLYDEPPSRAGLRVAAGSLVLALLLTWLKARDTPASFDSMFTTNIAWTVLQGIVWFGVFTLIFEFHPWHALGLGLATMLLVSGLATMGVDSLMTRTAPGSVAAQPFSPKPAVRQPLSPAPGPAMPADAAKAK
jgi:hypothetical protein